VIELTAKRPGSDNNVGDGGDAHEILARWSANKYA